MITVQHDPLPLIRGERQVDPDAVAMIGDQVADQVRVRQRVLNGV